ncbi:Cas9 inhibitor AcrIIA9 family protein [Parabacteroides distasonis]|uniref:PcfJ-like protein n=1 Tax=Parabacteroides distasonis TaxID=823 RepID=A0A6I2NS49_PARDI|nr:Cas9 inhibitor AcrIIA9 family protein [Parabacteroides distasonis]MRY89947.1 hypothetical protein [Parabacteroides distasonis]MRY99241.1 hypothetical protein [Parabacteroides distasonis]MRZ03423.1 hypothetical protein [Parabacteroides distasonis]MRZ33271.1 hypothetical protein [Parabacteroides distasonis]MRZ38043.1 hypothetical protein [Parabacteroides distasonis]
MKGTDHFKRTIYMYLEQRAEEDALFAKKYRNPAKNMDECVTHILNYVQKSGCNGFTDGEIFGQAIHYYEENEIEVGKPMDCQVVVNHVVKLTAEEKAEARQNAVRKYQEEELANKSKFFGLVITDEEIIVKVLESIDEYYNEGKTQGICVFGSGYYKKADTLILSARIGDEIIETVEVDLRTLEVVQCHGKHNQDTEYHERIIDLVNKNANLIRERMKAA